MNMVIPDDGKLKIADWAFANDGSSLPDMTLHLYQNNYTPDNASVLASFTESTFTGYAEVPILRAEFTTITLVSHVAYAIRSSAPQFTCSAGGPQTAYGWYLTSDDDDTVIAAQKFDTVRSMAAGAVESIDPFQIGLQTLH